MFLPIVTISEIHAGQERTADTHQVPGSVIPHPCLGVTFWDPRCIFLLPTLGDGLHPAVEGHWLFSQPWRSKSGGPKSSELISQQDELDQSKNWLGYSRIQRGPQFGWVCSVQHYCLNWKECRTRYIITPLVINSLICEVLPCRHAGETWVSVPPASPCLIEGQLSDSFPYLVL